MKANYQQRRQALRRKFKSAGIDALLVTNEINVRYLTGFSGDSSYLLMMPRDEVLLSDSRYTIQIQEECPELKTEIRTARTSLVELAKKAIRSSKRSNIGIESANVTKALFDQLADANKSVQLVGTDSLVEELRAIKDKSEIATIRRSIQIAERSFEVIRGQLRGSQTELEIAHNLEHQIRRFGGTRCSFDPIVGVGPRGALPHGQPSALTVDAFPFMLIDWGAQYQGYASDLTRILVTGKISPKLERIYNVVLDAQLAAIKKIRPGAKLVDIDRAARSVIEDAGFGKRFGHGLGHGFGLQIHEQPMMSPVAKGTVQAGMVVTVEPGIYLSNWGGVRIEDNILVTPDGNEVLSCVPKQLEACSVELL